MCPHRRPGRYTIAILKGAEKRERLAVEGLGEQDHVTISA